MEVNILKEMKLSFLLNYTDLLRTANSIKLDIVNFDLS